MKTIGLIGGLSWESTALYYKMINQNIKERLGGLNSAKLLLTSLNFHEVQSLAAQNQWDRVGEVLCHEALRLENAGADFILIGTNTMHLVADALKGKVSIPLIHLADAVADAIVEQKMSSIDEGIG